MLIQKSIIYCQEMLYKVTYLHNRGKWSEEVMVNGSPFNCSYSEKFLENVYLPRNGFKWFGSEFPTIDNLFTYNGVFSFRSFFIPMFVYMVAVTINVIGGICSFESSASFSILLLLCGLWSMWNCLKLIWVSEIRLQDQPMIDVLSSFY